MDHQLYLIPGMDKAVASIIKHDVPKIVAARVFACQRDMRERCERWSEIDEETESSGNANAKANTKAKAKAKKQSKFMAGYPQTTHILSQMLNVEDDDVDGIEDQVDPDYAPKRAGFVKGVDEIEVEVPSNGTIAKAEERFREAEAAFEKSNRAKAQVSHSVKP